MKKKIVAILLCISVSLLSVPFSVSAETAEPQGSLDRAQAVSKLEALSNGKIELHNKDGQVFLSGKLSDEKTPSEESASQFLNENKSIFGLSNPATELKAGKGHKDENGDTFVDYTQQINGLEVYGHKLTVHFDNTGVIRSVSGDLEEDKTITALGNTPITGNDAIQAAEKQFTYKSLRETPTAEKLILNKDGKNYAVYKVNISSMEPQIINNDVFVEANSGKIIDIQSNLRYDGPAPGSGITVQGATVPLNLYLAGSTYVMYDSTRPGVTDGIVTRDMQHGETMGYPATSLTGNYTDENSKASVSAHYNAGIVTDFYKNFYNRNSLDNALMEIDSFTHYKTNYNNAFWDGYEMIYGDGDGTRFTYLSGDLGIVGHEMTHAVINHTANLYYHNQSGALNESIADTFGVLIKTYNKYNVANGGNWTFNPSDWVIGEAVYTPGTPGDALRSLASPTICGQPDIMSNYQNLPDTEAGDYGGVHENSGIMNKAAYLLAQSVGMEKTAKIYYYALNHYMSMYTDFNGAQNCLYQAASDLYPTVPSVRAAVDNAFTAVGVNSVGSISMEAVPTKTTYFQGVALNVSGAVITVHYADGSTADMAVTSDMISGYNANQLGQQTITVTYRGKTTSFTVNVVVQAITSVKMKSYPAKTTYGLGQDLDLSGAQISVSYNDGSTVDMPVTFNMVSGYDANKLGQQTITVTYSTYITNFTVNVVVKALDHIFLTGVRTYTYVKGQNLDINGAAITAFYTDNSTENVPVTSDMVSGYNSDTIGKQTITVAYDGQTTSFEVTVLPQLSVNYQGHVQNVGWQNPVSDGAICGTTGQSLRVEALKINIPNMPAGLHIKYRTHVQNIGWQGWVEDGETAGTTGQSLRMEAIQIYLDGENAQYYDVLYQAHIEGIGWQGWVRSMQTAGTTGESRRIEALNIQIVPKIPTAHYITHVQNIGWIPIEETNGSMSGTTGRSLRVEAVKMETTGTPGVNIEYSAHVQSIGWQTWKSSGEIAGTTGQSLQMEALQIMLTGVNADQYSVYYQAHVQNIGWQNWVSDGATIGTTGQSLRVEAIRIIVMPKQYNYFIPSL